MDKMEAIDGGEDDGSGDDGGGGDAVEVETIESGGEWRWRRWR